MVAVGTISIVPFTWMFLLPVNEVLLQETEQGGKGEGRMQEKDLKKTVALWGRVNGWRCLLPALGDLVGLWMVLSGL